MKSVLDTCLCLFLFNVSASASVLVLGAESIFSIFMVFLPHKFPYVLTIMGWLSGKKKT